MMSAKMATPGLLKIKLFWKKCHDVIISVHDVTHKISSRDWNYNVNFVICPKFDNSSISVREVIITSIFQGFDEKNHFFEGWSWFMFNNLGLALGTNLKFYTSVKKELKLKVGEFWGANSYVCRSYREKTGRGPFWPPPPHLSSWIGLRKLNKLTYKKDKKKIKYI